jgi:hypothetical protein
MSITVTDGVELIDYAILKLLCANSGVKLPYEFGCARSHAPSSCARI